MGEVEAVGGVMPWPLELIVVSSVYSSWCLPDAGRVSPMSHPKHVYPTHIASSVNLALAKDEARKGIASSVGGHTSM